MPTFNTTDPKPGYVYDAAIDTWFPLLGIAPASQVDRWTKTAAGGETSLSGNDDNAESLSYTAGTEQVYLNGVLLVRGQDYTASNGTTITGLSALAASDIAEVVTFNPSNIITTDAVLSTDFDAKGDLISASAASTPIRVPVGTNGQVLKANSATTSGLEWGTVDDADAIQSSIVDAKGDIIAATAADTVARLAVGTNGQVLTAASGQATGLQWATPASGGMTLLSTTTLSGASTTISPIDQTYVDLYIRVDAMQCATAGSIRIAPNGTTTAALMTGSSFDRATVTGRGLNFTYVTQGTGDLKANSTENGFLLYINGYSTNATKKTALWYGTFINPSDVWHAVSYGGHISDGSQISSLVFSNSGGNLTGGTVYVYGVK